MPILYNLRLLFIIPSPRVGVQSAMNMSVCFCQFVHSHISRNMTKLQQFSVYVAVA